MMRRLQLFIMLSCFSAVCFSPFRLSAWCWDDFYAEVGSGFVTGLGRAKGTIGVGPVMFNGNAIAINAESLPGWFVEGKLGYICSPCLRFDASYTFISSEYHWQGVFGVASELDLGTPSVFESDLNAHIALFNAYVQLDQLCNATACWSVSPYIMGGIGAAWNNLNDIQLLISPIGFVPAVEYAKLKDHTTTNFAGRFGLGLLARVSCFTFNTAVRATYIGSVKTGDSRTNPGTSSIPIIPFDLKNNWLGDFYVGLNYRF